MASKTPAHTCRWYPISWSEGEPAVWACNVYRSCIKTITPKDHARLLRAAKKKGLTTIDGEPPRGV